MATKKGTTAAATEEKEAGAPKQGAAIILPNGERRIDFIRRRYYDDGVKRGEIKNEINKMYEDAGQEDKKITYQIVFSATKTDADPRVKATEAAAE